MWNFWKKSTPEPRMPEARMPEARTSVYVSKERAHTELRKQADKVQKDISAKNHFVSFVHGKLGWSLEKMLEDAMNTGTGCLSDYWFGNVWVMDPALVDLFSEAMLTAGFFTELKGHISDGPEADSFSLTIRPLSDKKEHA